ncbi:hypothetical protein K438DRAFT_1973432 [Mycena galopus ATCC 62051]|nr:hypothetical protein K438DRAFT_1973432 [Mycena galopus ATCC 62051]
MPYCLLHSALTASHSASSFLSLRLPSANFFPGLFALAYHPEQLPNGLFYHRNLVVPSKVPYVVSYASSHSTSPSTVSTLSSEDLTLHSAEFKENPRHNTPNSPNTPSTRPVIPPATLPSDNDILAMGNHDKMFYGDGRVGDWNPQDYLKKIKRLWLL